MKLGQPRDTLRQASTEERGVEQRDAAAARLRRFRELGPAFNDEERMLLGGAANRCHEIGVRREHEDRRTARREQLADRRGRQSCVERTRDPKVANVREFPATARWCW